MVRHAPDHCPPRRGVLGNGVEVPSAFPSFKTAAVTNDVRSAIGRLAAQNSLGDKDLVVCKRDAAYEAPPTKPLFSKAAKPPLLHPGRGGP